MPELWVRPEPRLIGAATVLQPDPPARSTDWLTRGRRPDRCPAPLARCCLDRARPGSVRGGRVRLREACAEVAGPCCRGGFPDSWSGNHLWPTSGLWINPILTDWPD